MLFPVHKQQVLFKFGKNNYSTKETLPMFFLALNFLYFTDLRRLIYTQTFARSFYFIKLQVLSSNTTFLLMEETFPYLNQI